MMDLADKKRLRLGILLYFSPKWMGGIVYIKNLIRILNFLDDDDKPEVVVFYRAGLRKYAEQVDFPYMNLIEWDFPPVYQGYIKSWILRKNVFVESILKNYNLDGLYPLQDYPLRAVTDTKIVSWYADLQHKYYPEFFTKRKIIERNVRIKFMLRNSQHLVVSSQAVADDFKRFFRLRDKMKIHVFHFASVIEDFEGLDIGEVRKKYNVPEDYFMISNQFHKHKNHRVLLQSMALLKQDGKEIHMAMTGRLPDASHSSYMKELHSIIADNNLKPHISLLGVIPRNEQLLLMKHSRAVIQPSLFEGWSTVIEDAISLQVPVIAANIAVNIEQLGSKGNYFDPHNDAELAEIISNFPDRNLGMIIYDDYYERMKKAATTFINIFRH